MNRPASYTADDFPFSPFVLFYETTRACDLVCKHCRACAQPQKHPKELSPSQSIELLKQITTFPKPPILVYTGGDPMKRKDIFDLVSTSVSLGLQTAMTPSVTPLLTNEAVSKLKSSGLGRLALSLDSSRAEVHDDFRGVNGSFDKTLKVLAYSQSIGLPTQINTTITNRNIHEIDTMANVFATLGITLWSVFFLIPVGRGLAEHRIEPWEYEYAFERLWENARKQPYGIKTTEAHHYRRFVFQHEGDPQKQPEGKPDGRIQRAPIGVNDGKGVIFVSHTGAVYPSGFMPINCGKFPDESIVDIYQNSPLLNSLRDGNLLKGKCHDCEYRHICGGSRARAYAVTRDPLAAEPDCVYLPALWKERALC